MGSCCSVSLKIRAIPLSDNILPIKSHSTDLKKHLIPSLEVKTIVGNFATNLRANVKASKSNKNFLELRIDDSSLIVRRKAMGIVKSKSETFRVLNDM